MNQPIKRHESLQPLSREHHHALLLCWKIRKGIARGIEPPRIYDYIKWFYLSHLKPHFILEEKFLFPVLGKDHEMIQKAIAEHRNLERLITGEESNYEAMEELATALENHIRYEERQLFNEIQNKASGEQLITIEAIHHEEEFCDNTQDAFWV